MMMPSLSHIHLYLLWKSKPNSHSQINPTMIMTQILFTLYVPPWRQTLGNVEYNKLRPGPISGNNV